MAGLFDRLQEDIEQRDKMAGMSPADLLMMPADEVAIIQVLARRGDLSLEAIVEALDLPEEEVLATLDRLREQGFARPLELKGGKVYRTYFARKRKSSSMGNIWDSLGGKLEGGQDEDQAGDAAIDEAKDDDAGGAA